MDMEDTNEEVYPHSLVSFNTETSKALPQPPIDVLLFVPQQSNSLAPQPLVLEQQQQQQQQQQSTHLSISLPPGQILH